MRSCSATLSNCRIRGCDQAGQPPRGHRRPLRSAVGVRVQRPGQPHTHRTPPGACPGKTDPLPVPSTKAPHQMLGAGPSCRWKLPGEPGDRAFTLAVALSSMARWNTHRSTAEPLAGWMVSEGTVGRCLRPHRQAAVFQLEQVCSGDDARRVRARSVFSVSLFRPIVHSCIPPRAASWRVGLSCARRYSILLPVCSRDLNCTGSVLRHRVASTSAM